MPVCSCMADKGCLVLVSFLHRQLSVLQPPLNYENSVAFPRKLRHFFIHGRRFLANDDCAEFAAVNAHAIRSIEDRHDNFRPRSCGGRGLSGVCFANSIDFFLHIFSDPWRDPDPRLHDALRSCLCFVLMRREESFC